MKSLKKYLIQEDQNKLISELYKIKDIDKWLFESYEDYISNNEYISEDDFYKQKYLNYDGFSDNPQYWIWQNTLYENLSNSLNSDNNLMIKLISYVHGIEKIEIIKNFVLNIYYNNEFNEKSLEFQRVLNFSNYFIQSKYINNNLPNPFKIEARKPQKIDYKDKYAYHVTHKYFYENKIEKYGLILKDKTFLVQHDPRIYLWINPINIFVMKAFGHFILRLWNDENISKNPNHEYYNKIDNYNLDKDLILLQIDLEQFNNDHGEKLILYGDPAFNNNGAVFTLENIPTKYIKKISFKELETYTND